MKESKHKEFITQIYCQIFIDANFCVKKRKFLYKILKILISEYYNVKPDHHHTWYAVCPKRFLIFSMLKNDFRQELNLLFWKTNSFRFVVLAKDHITPSTFWWTIKCNIIQFISYFYNSPAIPIFLIDIC